MNTPPPAHERNFRCAPEDRNMTITECVAASWWRGVCMTWEGRYWEVGILDPSEWLARVAGANYYEKMSEIRYKLMRPEL